MNSKTGLKLLPFTIAISIAVGCTKGSFSGKTDDGSSSTNDLNSVATFTVGGKTSSILTTDEGLFSLCQVKYLNDIKHDFEINIYNKSSKLKMTIPGIDAWLALEVGTVSVDGSLEHLSSPLKLPATLAAGAPTSRAGSLLLSHTDENSYSRYNTTFDETSSDFICENFVFKKERPQAGQLILNGTMSCRNLIPYVGPTSRNGVSKFDASIELKCKVSFSNPAEASIYVNPTATASANPSASPTASSTASGSPPPTQTSTTPQSK